MSIRSFPPKIEPNRIDLLNCDKELTRKEKTGKLAIRLASACTSASVFSKKDGKVTLDASASAVRNATMCVIHASIGLATTVAASNSGVDLKTIAAFYGAFAFRDGIEASVCACIAGAKATASKVKT